MYGSMMITKSPITASSPAAIAISWPNFRDRKSARTPSFRERSRLTTSRTPSVEPSSTNSSS